MLYTADMVHHWWKNTVSFCGGFFVVLIVIGIAMLLMRMHVRAQEQYQMVTRDHSITYQASEERAELHLGAVGSDVTEVQRALVAQGIAPDGAFVDEIHFGEKLQYYVMSFQLAHDLAPTGIVDQMTWQALEHPSENAHVIDHYVPIDPGYFYVTGYYGENYTKTAYLTFNVDGNVSQVERIVKILKKHHAHATFFFAHHVAQEHPDTVKMVFDAGHGIGILLWDEWYNANRTDQEIASELLSSTTNIAQITGRTPWCARPTHNMFLAATQNKIARQSVRMMYWDVDPQDRFVSSDVMTRHVLSYTQPDDVILFHIEDPFYDEIQSVTMIRILSAMEDDQWQFAALSCM